MQRLLFGTLKPRRVIGHLMVVGTLTALVSCNDVSQQEGPEGIVTDVESNEVTQQDNSQQQVTQAPTVQEPNDTLQEPNDSESSGSEPSDAGWGDRYAQLRQEMVDWQLARRDIVNKRVLEVMGRVPRHEFVTEGLREVAYQDSALPIAAGQTISQPYIVALMTQLVDPKPEHKALDIGTGSGYQAAVLAEIVDRVYSIEIVESLADEARQRLIRLGYKNIEVRHGDGYAGWPSEAPFDLITVAAAPDHVPPALLDQLATGGKLVIPIGNRFQSLVLFEKQPDGSVERTDVTPVMFVPMTGEAER